MDEDDVPALWLRRVFMANYFGPAYPGAGDPTEDDILLDHPCQNPLRASDCVVRDGPVTEYSCPVCKKPLVTIVDTEEPGFENTPGHAFKGFRMENAVPLRHLSTGRGFPILTPLVTLSSTSEGYPK